MKFTYKTYVDRKYNPHVVDEQQITWCCDEFSRTIGNQIVYEPGGNEVQEDIFIGFRQKRRTGRDSTEPVQINYCPFCGEEIELVQVGKFKTVTEEVQVK